MLAILFAVHLGSAHFSGVIQRTSLFVLVVWKGWHIGKIAYRFKKWCDRPILPRLLAEAVIGCDYARLPRWAMTAPDEPCAKPSGSGIAIGRLWPLGRWTPAPNTLGQEELGCRPSTSQGTMSLRLVDFHHGPLGWYDCKDLDRVGMVFA